MTVPELFLFLAETLSCHVDLHITYVYSDNHAYLRPLFYKLTYMYILKPLKSN